MGLLKCKYVICSYEKKFNLNYSDSYRNNVTENAFERYRRANCENFAFESCIGDSITSKLWNF